MGQGRAGWWIAGLCAAVVLVSIGYGMGRRAASVASPSSVPPAGAPFSTIQVEPIQPHEELAAITAALLPASTAPTVPAGQSPAASILEESARVKEIQRALKAAGFDPGPIDGQMGIRTRAAVRDFQVAHELEPDGKVGPKTWNKLESFLRSQAVSGD